MNKKSGTSKAAADKLVKNIRRKTRQTYSAEEKIPRLPELVRQNCTLARVWMVEHAGAGFAVSGGLGSRAAKAESGFFASVGYFVQYSPFCKSSADQYDARVAHLQREAANRRYGNFTFKRSCKLKLL